MSSVSPKMFISRISPSTHIRGLPTPPSGTLRLAPLRKCCRGNFMISWITIFFHG
jgi:hypothetical protein